MREGLSLKALVAARRAHTSSTHKVTENSNLVQAFRANETPLVAKENVYLVHDKDHPELQPQIGIPQGGLLDNNEASLSSWLARLAADYDFRHGEHDFKAFAFAELRTAHRTNTPFSGYGIQYDRGNQVYTSPLIFRKLAEKATATSLCVSATTAGSRFRSTAPTDLRAVTS